MHLMSVLFLLPLTADDCKLFDFETMKKGETPVATNSLLHSHSAKVRNQICKTISRNSFSNHFQVHY